MKISFSSGGLQLMLVILKAVKVIHWSWFAVFLPTIIPLAISALAFGLALVYYGFIESPQQRERRLLFARLKKLGM